MDTITVFDVIFGAATTLALGALAVVQFVSEKRQRKFEDKQFAIDVQASASALEVVEILSRSQLSPCDKEVLKQTHAIASARLGSMTSYSRLDEETRTSVENAVARLIKPLDGDTDVQALQARMNTRYGMNVQTDRSAYSWNGEGKHPKYVLLHLIAQKFIADHSITLRSEFDSLFGKQISAALSGGVAGKSPSAQRLLDQIAREGRYAPRDQKLVEQFGAISFDGVDYRAGWGLGFASVQDIGRVVQKPVIEHFRKMPGYAIEQA